MVGLTAGLLRDMERRIILSRPIDPWSEISKHILLSFSSLEWFKNLKALFLIFFENQPKFHGASK